MKLSIEKKKELVSLYYNGIPVSEICQEYQISRSTFYTWIRTYRPIESQNSSRIVNEGRILEQFFWTVSKFGPRSYGDPAEIRTPDTLLKRQVLCQLSYWVI